MKIRHYNRNKKCVIEKKILKSLNSTNRELQQQRGNKVKKKEKKKNKREINPGGTTEQVKM